MRLRRPALSAAAAALLALSAQAQTPPPPALPPQTAPAGSVTDDGSTVVDALEITARPLGPAMWRVKRGESEVIIVGGYSPLPHSLDWNKFRLERALDGARGFYEAKASLNPFELAGLVFNQGDFKLGRGHTLDGEIGPARAARLRRVAVIAHSDPGRMQPYKPAVAGVLAYQTFIRTVGWSGEKPGTTMRRLAAAHHVPVRALAKVGVPSLVKALTRADMTAQLSCFDATLDQTEHESAHGLAAAQAWANGRVTELRGQRSTAILDRCVADSGGGRALLTKGIADSVASIDDILAKPGKNIALVNIEFLLPKNGVLDRLKAQGFEITLPQE